jgi:hypothetical protein
MSRTAKLITAIGFTAILLGLGVADAMLTGPEILIPREEETTGSDRGTGGVMKQNGPDILATLSGAELDVQDTNELSLLSRALPAGTAIIAKTLLKGNDRLAYVAWTQSPDVKIYFIALKDALQKSFTPQVRDLSDRTEVRDAKPTRNILTFVDPGFNPERYVFLRVRERLYEFHVAEGRDAEVFALVDLLSE